MGVSLVFTTEMRLLMTRRINSCVTYHLCAIVNDQYHQSQDNKDNLKWGFKTEKLLVEGLPCHISHMITRQGREVLLEKKKG